LFHFVADAISRRDAPHCGVMVNIVMVDIPSQTAPPFAVKLPASSQDGFLGGPLRLRSSTRACIPAWRPNNSGLVSPTKNTVGINKNSVSFYTAQPSTVELTATIPTNLVYLRSMQCGLPKKPSCDEAESLTVKS
jgi:hypothetical protein